jgi:hypothetical protein
MTKKLFVVLVVVAAMLVTFTWVMGAKKAVKGPLETFEKFEFTEHQTPTPMPKGELSEPLTPTALSPLEPFPSTAAVGSGTPAPKLPVGARGAYPLSTAAAKPDKVEGYRPPQHSYEGVLVQEGGEDCASAVAITVPFNSTGYTCDNYDDYEEQGVFECPYSSTSPDVVYSYTPSVDEVINIDMYGSSYDTKIWVYEDVCQTANLVACNDDYYPDYVSAIFGLPIYVGHTYYIVVDGYGGDCGDYLIDITYYVPCDVVCPDNGIPEGEPDCYDGYVDNYNAGCNEVPYVFQDVNCGDTICGKSGTYIFDGGNYRDTDWFRVVLGSATTLSWKAVAEFPLLIFIIDAGSEDCVDYTILGNTTANECDTAFLSFDVPAGVYWLWAGPSVFTGVDCGKEYVGIVGCEVATTGACCLDYDPYTCTMETPEDCDAMPDHTFLGLGTDCGPPNPCLPGPENDECTGAPVISTFPTTVYGTTVGATIDCPGVLDWNAVWYDFYLPYDCNNLSIDFCPSDLSIYQIGIVVYDECPPDCPGYILTTGYQWVTCPSGYDNPQLWWNSLPGPAHYWFPVAVWDESMNPFIDFGFEVNVEECGVCDVVCPDGGIPEGEPDCYDGYVDNYNAGCNEVPYVFQDVNCGDTICGKSGTYIFDGGNYRDTDWFRVVLGSPNTLSWKAVAEFPLLIFIMDAGSEDCLDYTTLGYTTANECDTAFLSFDVPAGVYWLWAGPSVFSGIDCGVEYVGVVGCEGGGVDSTCELVHDNGSAASYFSGWDIGDQNAVYMDPEALCPDCDPVYPLLIEMVKAYIYDHAGAGSVDVMVHLYEVGAALCDGPGAAFYSYGPVTVTDFYPDAWAEIVLPEVLCVDGPFFLAIEYMSGTVGSVPSILFDSNPPVDTCYQWNDYQDYGWIEWWDFWSTPADVGWLMLRAVGVCNSGACDQGVACDLIQDVGVIAYYFGSWAAGDAIGKYFDPEVYCEPEVYPYKIHDVEFLLYNFAGETSVDIIVDVHIVCQDSCDGPGTQIYKSEPITVDTWYPDMAHIVLPEQVCVFEPFFLSLEYATGVQGTTPSFLWAPEDYPCDSCHVWMYWASGGYPFWIEWNDFWSPPAGGCPIIRVTGFTEHPDCDFAPCDTTLDTLWGGTYAYYFWKNPSAYGDRYLNERFDMPLAGAGGRLDEIQIAFYDEGSGTHGTPDPEIYVWLSDGLYPVDNNPPYQAIAQFNMAYGDIAWYPGWNLIQAYELGMMFDAGESFHIGYGHAFIAGDTLCCLSNAGDYVSDRSVEWLESGEWGTFLDDWGIGIDIMINAVICPNPLEESTFTVSCSPFMNYATPGDPPADLFQVDVGSLMGYNLNVDLDCTPPAGINVSFNPDDVPAPYTSDVSVSVDPGVTYGDYTLTFCGTGSDGQGPKCCDVTLRVQAPYDECLVDFYHGKQRATNFGAVADHNNSGESFLWYGIRDLLFDGSFIIATGVDNMALDMTRSHEHWDWVPVDYLDCYYEPKWPANIGYAEFYSKENIPGEHDSVYVIGIMDSCVDFSVKIKIYYNPTGSGYDIEDMWLAMWEDWDMPADPYNNWGAMDSAHNLVWMHDDLDETMICGLFKAPFYDDPMFTIKLVPNAYYLWPEGGYGIHPESLWSRLLTNPEYWEAQDVGVDSQDFSVFMSPGAIDLYEGDAHIEIWIDFCRDTDVDNLTWSQWWHRVLRYVGFYRGDVNASDTLELPALDVSDLVYLIQYLFQYGPAPLPYVDQGDVNADMKVDIGDVVYLLNHVFHYGQAPPPIDYVRFIHEFWPRESLFENDTWK